jgi:hypothetical protein
VLLVEEEEEEEQEQGEARKTANVTAPGRARAVGGVHV